MWHGFRKRILSEFPRWKKWIWRFDVGAERSWAHQRGRDCAMCGILDMLDQRCDSPVRTMEPDRPVWSRNGFHSSTPQLYATCNAIWVGEVEKWPIYYIPFLPESLQRTLDRPAGITNNFVLFCSSMTYCVALARGDMPNKVLVLNNLCESLQWPSEHTDTSSRSWSLDLRWSSYCHTTLL